MNNSRVRALFVNCSALLMLAGALSFEAQAADNSVLLEKLSGTYSYVLQSPHDNPQPDIQINISQDGDCFIFNSAKYCNGPAEVRRTFKLADDNQSAILAYQSDSRKSRVTIDADKKSITIREVTKYRYSGFLFLIIPTTQSIVSNDVQELSCEHNLATYKQWREDKNHKILTSPWIYTKVVESCD